MPPAKRKRAAAQRHSLIRQRASEEGVVPDELSVPLPGPSVLVPDTNSVPPMSAIVAELLQQMRAEGLVMRQPATGPQPAAAAGSSNQRVASGLPLHQSTGTVVPLQQMATMPPQQMAVMPPQQMATMPPQQMATMPPQQIAAMPPQLLATTAPLAEHAMLQITGTPAQQYIPNVSRPLDVNVDIKTKQKIWAEQYVDFGSLLQNKDSEQFDITIQANTLALIPKTKPVAIKTMDHWISALQIFVTIVVQAKPELAGPLMKYANIVQHIARKAGDQAAFAYDFNFRKWRQAAPHQLPFDQANNELFLEAMTFNDKLPTPVAEDLVHI